jgi:nitrile hydratase
MGGALAEQRLKVVENTEDQHNVVVCTLCSCYPLALLGPSPTWYKSPAYRSLVVRDPRRVLREFGFTLDPAVKINVWDANAESRYMVLPRRPAGSGNLDEQALAALVTRDGLIGVAPV